jgi:hypothetical protein
VLGDVNSLNLLELFITRRSQATGQDSGRVATFPGRPFLDLQCYQNFETNSTFKIHFDKSMVKFVKLN